MMYPQLVQPDFRPGRDKQKMTSVGDIGWKVSGFGPVVKCKQVNRRIDVEFQFGSPSFIRQSCVSQVHVHSQVISLTEVFLSTHLGPEHHLRKGDIWTKQTALEEMINSGKGQRNSARACRQYCPLSLCPSVLPWPSAPADQRVEQTSRRTTPPVSAQPTPGVSAAH